MSQRDRACTECPVCAYATEAVAKWLSGGCDRNGGRAERLLRHRLRTSVPERPAPAAEPPSPVTNQSVEEEVEEDEEREIPFDMMCRVTECTCGTCK